MNAVVCGICLYYLSLYKYVSSVARGRSIRTKEDTFAECRAAPLDILEE